MSGPFFVPQAQEGFLQAGSKGIVEGNTMIEQLFDLLGGCEADLVGLRRDALAVAARVLGGAAVRLLEG